MAMSCDHAPTRASLVVFRESTMFVGFQELGDGKTAILGQCRRCKSTVAIEIDVARGSVVHGEIEADTEPSVRNVIPVDTGAPNGHMCWNPACRYRCVQRGEEMHKKLVAALERKTCQQNPWCGNHDGHEGICEPPF